MKRPNNRQPGVTLIELMVAISITSLMMFLIHTIFNEITNTTSRGTATGEFIRRSRAISAQLRSDTVLYTAPTEDSRGRMVGPKGEPPQVNPPNEFLVSPGGFLVIINHQIAAPLTADDALSGQTRLIRSDQLLFVLNNQSSGGTERLPVATPAYDNTFGGEVLNSKNAKHARVFYGHVRQIREDGSTSPSDELGAVNGGNPNRIAQNWVLGRQALFLSGDGSPPTAPTTMPPTGTWNTGIRAVATLPFGPSATGPRAAVLDDSNSSLGLLGQGLTDVSFQTLANLMHPTASNPTSGQGYLGTAPDALTYQIRVLGIGSGGTSALTGGMCFNKHRLLTNAKPVDTDLSTGNVAPMHTYFANGVSDFIIEYAHDYYTDESELGPPDGKIDMVIHSSSNEREIRWYSFYPNNSSDDHPLVFLPPTTSITNPAAVTGPAGTYAAGGAFVWQHFDPKPGFGFTEWPWLIRVRYRLHDRNGDFTGRRINIGTPQEQEEPGEWFEVILPVNRQPDP